MTTFTEFHEANRKLITACQMLIDDGATDPVGYQLFVRIHMDSWLRDMGQVALRLAARGATLTAPHGLSTSDLLGRMRATAHRQLDEALSVGDAAAASRAAVFACGAQLALDCLDAESGG